MNKQILIVVLQEGIYKMQEWTHQIIHVIIYIIFDSFSSNMKDNFPLGVLTILLSADCICRSYSL